ncbi:MAG TPA: ABC-type transport auxiliary lipoprotein family protein, partial [Myxococcota bacterium]|nr:ABC-type transport auxiliary lipoprotein family protein [Myxococcota bacterium]
MKRDDFRACCRGALAACAWSLAGCTALPPPVTENVTTYVLDAQAAPAAVTARRDLVLVVGGVRARPGFDTPQIAYVRQAHELDYFVTARWAETPARMLGPLIAQALERSGTFRAVVQSPAVVPADVRLDV